MPGHALGAIVIEVEEAGVEGFSGGGFNVCFEPVEEGVPGEGSFGFSRVGVVETFIAKPSDLAGGGDGFAKHFDDVVLPGKFVEQAGKKLIGFGDVEDGAVVDGLAIEGEEVPGWEEIESHGHWKTIIFWLAGVGKFVSDCAR